jgi:hypothetical protein
MRYRPKRENYPIGIYGDIDYQESLERYCTYLENRNKALTEQCNIVSVVGQSEQLVCSICGEEPNPNFYEEGDNICIDCFNDMAAN